MLFQKPNTSTMEEMLDKFAVKELIEFERYCRDNALWEQMRKCFAQDSRVVTSWYNGDGQGFVEASRKMQTVAPHKINNTLVWLNGSKAVAVTMACIQSRKEVNGRMMDLSSYVRLIYTAAKEETGWKLKSLDAIYEKDCLVPAFPEGMSPPPTARASYANVISVIGSEGYEMNDQLAGDDRPDLRDALLGRISVWLG
ncbi:MAG: nuclear transport factor 2 family protein [Clostridiales bacterium]|jgi:hypothetical protein|nr:nuclear transport factor 2 family protein [Clostridiales bacterium]